MFPQKCLVESISQGFLVVVERRESLAHLETKGQGHQNKQRRHCLKKSFKIVIRVLENYYLPSDSSSVKGLRREGWCADWRRHREILESVHDHMARNQNRRKMLGILLFECFETIHTMICLRKRIHEKCTIATHTFLKHVDLFEKLPASSLLPFCPNCEEMVVFVHRTTNEVWT